MSAVLQNEFELFCGIPFFFFNAKITREKCREFQHRTMEQYALNDFTDLMYYFANPCPPKIVIFSSLPCLLSHAASLALLAATLIRLLFSLVLWKPWISVRFFHWEYNPTTTVTLKFLTVQISPLNKWLCSGLFPCSWQCKRIIQVLFYQSLSCSLLCKC